MTVKRINKKLTLIKMGNRLHNYREQKKDILEKIPYSDQYKFKVTTYIGLLPNLPLHKFLEYFNSEDDKIYTNSYMNRVFNRDIVVHAGLEINSWNYWYTYIKIFNIYILVNNYRVTYLDFITQLNCLVIRYCRTTLSKEVMDKLINIQENYLKDDIEPGIAMVGIELFKQIVKEHDTKLYH